MRLLEDIRQSIIEAEEDKAAELTERALENFDPEEILDKALKPAMDVVGEEYERGIRYIPEMILSADAMKKSMEKLRPLLTESGVEPEGVVIIGTVEGDFHDIGQNLVSMMFEGAGFKVHKLGVDITAGDFVEAVKREEPDILGMSALLTSTMTYMPKVIEALGKAGLRDQVKVLIGGAPVTQDYATEIGADGYGKDAAAAVRVARKLLKKLSK